jgi:hypothetical protein
MHAPGQGFSTRTDNSLNRVDIHLANRLRLARVHVGGYIYFKTLPALLFLEFEHLYRDSRHIP